VKKFNQILGNTILIITSTLVTWSAGISVLNSFIQYGAIPTILSFIIGIPVFVGAITIVKLIENKLKIR
jgi:uncharacterized membrane protein